MNSKIREPESKSDIQLLSVQQLEQTESNPFINIPKSSTNFFYEGVFTDDQFKLNTSFNDPSIVIKRLSQIYQANTPLFVDLKNGKLLHPPTKKQINPSKPIYLSQINMLPFSHYRKLIEPPYIHNKGFYHVVMFREGIMYKQVIDDTFHYNTQLNKFQTHPYLEEYPWILILLKAWAKINKGYENLSKCQSFDFIRTFTYPDWQTINPSQQYLQKLIRRLSAVNNRKQFMVAKTKNDEKVGYFGFTPGCASFVVRGHYQEYGQIFIKIYPYVYDHWNSQFCDDESSFPQENPPLQENEFIIPRAQFFNVFHLLFSTTNKYEQNPRPNASIENKMPELKISYQKFIINIDARDTKAIIIAFDLTADEKQTKQLLVGLSLYLPKIKIYDLVHSRPLHGPGDLVVPWCKAIMGYSIESSNFQADYVESVKQKMLDYGENTINFVSTNRLYDFIAGEYFKGYSNDFSNVLALKPGRFYIRLKIEQKQSEYRCFLNATVIQGTLKIHDAKMADVDQVIMLKDCLLSKAIQEQKFITFVNPMKKGSWICSRNEFETLGYGYILVETIKNNEFKVQVVVNPKKVKECGYWIKGHKQMLDYTLEAENGQNIVLIIKYDNDWKKTEPRVWPPSGIEFFRHPRLDKC